MRTALLGVLGAALAHTRAQLPGKPLPNAPLRNFQVQEPLAVPHGVKTCTVQFVHHLFANSYGQPAIVDYAPPEGCGDAGSWSRVVANFTATSNGTQFDRLANVYLHDVEIWRTSTPEPTAKGIIWTALKDVTYYRALLARPGNLTIDLGNLLDSSSGLTGEYDVTFSAIFYSHSDTIPSLDTSDVILPISTAAGQAAHVPDALVTNLTLPRNGAKAFVEIYATGDSDEEFWYGNVPDQYFDQLPTWSAPDGYANGKGPFREVQLLIDGTLAGVAFPYPVIYTGEFLPTIWRPMVSYGAFDSPTYYIDITPFLPLLSDGAAHSFTLAVLGMGANNSINADWIVSGNVQIWLDASAKPTTGRITSYTAAPYVVPTVTGSVAGPAPNVSVSTRAERKLSIAGEVRTGSGKTTSVRWEQDLAYTNTEVYTVTSSNISTQNVVQRSSGTSLSTHDSVAVPADTFAYPFSLLLTYNQTGALYDYGVHLDHAYTRALGVPGLVQSDIDTRQVCNGSQYQHVEGVRVRTGTITEEYRFADAAGGTYRRSVGTYNVANTTSAGTVSEASLLYNDESGTLARAGLEVELQWRARVSIRDTSRSLVDCKHRTLCSVALPLPNRPPQKKRSRSRRFSLAIMPLIHGGYYDRRCLSAESHYGCTQPVAENEQWMTV